MNGLRFDKNPEPNISDFWRLNTNSSNDIVSSSQNIKGVISYNLLYTTNFYLLGLLGNFNVWPRFHPGMMKGKSLEMPIFLLIYHEQQGDRDC